MEKKKTLAQAVQRAVEGGLSEVEAVWAKDAAEFGKWELFLYRHEFAKALFGEGPSKEWYVDEPGENKMKYTPSWQYHLKGLVLSEDPVEYIANYLKSPDN